MATTDEKQNRQTTDIRMILRDLLKVFKVVALYPEDNPLPQSLRRTFAERLVDLIGDYGALDFAIDRENVYYQNEVAFTDRTREEALAGMFFETGIIRITFQPGIEVEEIYRLLDAVKAYQNADRRTSDLAANLWEAGLKHFTFETVEDISLRQYEGDMLIQALDGGDDYQQNAGDESADYEDIFTDSGEAGSDGELPVEADRFENSTLSETDKGIDIGDSSDSSVLSTGDPESDSTLKVLEAIDAMGLGDASGEAPRPLPDTKLILNSELKLSEEEVEQVEALVRRDAEFVEYESVCELVKEILHQEGEMNDFYESVTIGEKVLMEFVKQGRLAYAADLLHYFVTLEGQLGKERPLWSERLKDARVSTGSRERLAILCQALNDNSEIGDDELRSYLENFEWEALMGITDMMGDLLSQAHRDTVRDYLTLRGKDRVHIVARGITDRRLEVVVASTTILARIGGSQALQQLDKAIEHPEPEVRRAMATALAECPSDECLSLLRRLVNDSDDQVRELAVQAILARRGQPAFDTLTEVLNDDQFFKLGPDTQQSVLIAYSTLGGDLAVDYLVRLGEKVNPFKSADLSFYRTAAFEALAHNRGEKAERTLVNLAGSWRKDIKAHARAALQRRRELIYGGDDDPSE